MRRCRKCNKACRQAVWRRSKFCSGSCRTKYFNALRPKGERYASQSCIPAVKVPTDLDIAWAAGIYEGEGSISRPYQTQRVCVAQKDLWLLKRLKEFFGGSMYRSKSSRCSYWYLSGPRARGFIFLIFPFLSPRRKLQIRKVANARSIRGWSLPSFF